MARARSIFRSRGPSQTRTAKSAGTRRRNDSFDNAVSTTKTKARTSRRRSMQRSAAARKSIPPASCGRGGRQGEGGEKLGKNFVGGAEAPLLGPSRGDGGEPHLQPAAVRRQGRLD